MKVVLKRLSSDYGMAGVLVLLCGYYSWATYTTHEPRGEAAAPVLATQVARSAPKGANVLIVARATDEDARFADTLEARLKADGLNVAGKVLGDPRAARQALQKHDAERTALAAIATTPECSAWTVFEGISQKYPNLGQPRLAIPQ